MGSNNFNVSTPTPAPQVTPLDATEETLFARVMSAERWDATRLSYEMETKYQLKVSPSTIRNWMKGITDPPVGKALTVASIIGYDFMSVFGDRAHPAQFS